MMSNIEGIFDDSDDEHKKPNNKFTDPNKIDSKFIKENKWGQSKKSKKKYRRQKNIKKRINLLELDFTLLIKEDQKEKIENLKNYINLLFLNIEKLELSDRIEEENDFGNTEYKLKLVDSSSERIQHLTTQMKFRLKEGSGEAYYRIGFEDNGNNLGLQNEDFLLTLSTICYIARDLNVEVIVDKVMRGQNGLVCFITVRTKIAETIKLELKIMLLGSTSAGKSTLLGVILSDKLDNGKGEARIKILNHKHEVLTGVTSSLTYTVVGFDQKGDVITQKSLINSWETTVDNSHKIISFIDYGGAEKHHRKAFQGFLSSVPDFTLLFLSIMNSFEEIRNQLEMTITLQCNFGIVVTHIDQATQKEQNELIKFIRNICFQYEDFIPIVVRNEEDAVYLAKSISEPILPIFFISNVSGKNLNLFKKFLNILPTKNPNFSQQQESTEFIVQNKIVKEANDYIILLGWVYQGQLRKNQKMFLGPLANQSFIQVIIQEIQCYKIPVRSALMGQTCSIKIRILKNKNAKEIFNSIKKGCVLVDTVKAPSLTQQFIATITLSNTKENISINNLYEPVLVSETFQQSCWLNEMTLKPLRLEKKHSKSKDVIPRDKNFNKKRSESFFLNIGQDLFQESPQKEFQLFALKKNKLIVRFKFRPEYVKLGQKFVIYDQKLKASGEVVKLL